MLASWHFPPFTAMHGSGPRQSQAGVAHASGTERQYGGAGGQPLVQAKAG